MHVESVCTVVLSSALLFLYVCLSLPVGLEFRRLWRFGGIVFGNSGAFRAQSPGVRLALRILSWALWMSLLSMTLSPSSIKCRILFVIIYARSSNFLFHSCILEGRQGMAGNPAYLALQLGRLDSDPHRVRFFSVELVAITDMY